ncbi:MAG: serine/threonine protein kinase [Deltaproteobacteria bacterium]|nr:serine/threonine protein kinase [Deltaproteobacteria bacterium]
MQRAQQLGRYHLLDRIAFGGMAEIYRAKTFDSDGRMVLVAVKRVLAHLAEDEDFLKMLVDEAKIVSLIQHPGIARVYEFSRASNEYFMAMEFVDGKDVRAILERCRNLGKAMPPQHAAYIVAEIGAALHAAHAARDMSGRALRLVHRDISPANMICSYAGEVKLCDFGIAKATLSRVKTKTGIIKGKIKYMSPEQAMGRKLDHRSDIFSLGSVLYEMVTKTPPFLAQNEMELLIKVRDARYKAPDELEPQLPFELIGIINKALTRNRGERYQSAAEFAHALREYLAYQHPGYGRSHLATYMRRLFEAEIEKELRLMESYVIDQVEVAPAQMGENLIADALGPDAQYSKFTPIARGGTGVGSQPHERGTGTGVGSETGTGTGTGTDPSAEGGTGTGSGTLERGTGTGTGTSDWDQESQVGTMTRLPPTDPRRKYGAWLHDLQTVILDRNRQPDGRPVPTVHDEQTRILDPGRAPMPPAGASTRRQGSVAPRVPGGPGGPPPSIHDEQTMILDVSQPPKKK